MVSRNLTWIIQDDEFSYFKKWFGPNSSSDTWRSYGLRYNPAVGTLRYKLYVAHDSQYNPAEGTRMCHKQCIWLYCIRYSYWTAFILWLLSLYELKDKIILLVCVCDISILRPLSRVILGVHMTSKNIFIGLPLEIHVFSKPEMSQPNDVTLQCSPPSRLTLRGSSSHQMVLQGLIPLQDWQGMECPPSGWWRI